MISSLVITVAICAVAVSQEIKLVKLVSERKKQEPRVAYNEEGDSGYPLIVQQPYPIIVEKRIPYSEERYDQKAPNPRDYGSRDEFGYGPEVVRSPIIFTVSSRPAPRRFPYPLRIQNENWSLSCTEEDPNCYEKTDYPTKRTVKKKNTYTHKFGEGVKDSTKINERDVPNISSDYEKKEGSVQHRETFQTPILIALEKPGYKYVKHLVGAGILPKARQFHVLILEEDVTADKHEEPHKSERDQEDELENSSPEDIVDDNKQEDKAEDNKPKRDEAEGISNGSDSETITPSKTEGSLLN